MEGEHAVKIAQAREKDCRAKERMKAYADKRRRARENNFKVGDKVLLRKNFGKKIFNKTDSLFEKSTYTIKRVNGTLIEAIDDNGRSLVRNAAFFKLDSRRRQEQEDEEECEPMTRSRSEVDATEADANSNIGDRVGEQLRVDATGEVNNERGETQEVPDGDALPRRSGRNRKAPERFVAGARK
jgi:hypothetical protein